MGWLWSSSPAPKAPEPIPRDSAAAPPSSSAASSSSPPTPHESVDPEIQKFLELFQADKSQTPSSPSTTTSSIASPSDHHHHHQPPAPPAAAAEEEEKSTLSSWLSLKSSPSATAKRAAAAAATIDAPPRDALAEALLPDDMSCRQAFDQAWACNSLGGQWNAVYRHGEMRSCSEHWDDFWFCMRTKSYSPEMRAGAIRAHYRNKEHAKYGPGRPSSEDVWESRREKVAPGTVFTEKIE